MRASPVSLVLMVLALLPCTASLAQIRLQGRAVAVEGLTPILDQPTVTYHVARAQSRPVLDGKADEWQGIPAMVLDRKEQSGNKWTGPTDLSGALRLQWDADNLYFCLDVTDDVHTPSNGEKDFWASDGMQFVFDAYMNGPRGGYDCEELSFMICDSPQGAMMAGYRVRGEQDTETRIPDQAVAMAAKPDGGHIFEWAMPWSRLAPVAPAFFGRCGFSFTLNDNDGQGFKNALFWTPGIVWGKNAGRFGQLIFDGAAGAQDAALPLPLEVPLFTDETHSRWLNLPGITPCGTARLLYYSVAGGTITAQVEVYRPGARTPLAIGTATGEAAARGMLAFAWNLNMLPTGDYEVVYRAPALAALPAHRFPYQHLHAAQWQMTKAGLRTLYGLDRPLDDLSTASPVIRRHRGLVAMLMHFYESENWAYESLLYPPTAATLLSQRKVVEIITMLGAGKDYFATLRDQSWQAYYSPVDSSGQPFVITLPAQFSPHKTYPLIVSLHGAGGCDLPTGEKSTQTTYLMVNPWGRGNNGYRALGEEDILRVIAFMREWYRIDPNRIYITGLSMGGRGTWLMASRHPDRFAAAAPVYGYTDGLPLENLRNVPVFNQHGQVDWVVSVAQSRYAVSALQQMGYSVLHKEYPTLGHEIVPVLYDKDAWLLNFRLNRRPKAITYTCETPAQGKAYWVNIRQFAEVHKLARVQARVTHSGQAQGLTLHLDNVAVLDCDIANMPVARKLGLRVQIGDTCYDVAAPLPAHLIIIRQDSQWAITDRWTPPASTVRPYRAGAAANLYEGEPLLIVYGTAGGVERTQLLREAAESLVGFSGASDRRAPMPSGRIPMKADSDVTPEDLAQRNLIIIGSARDNLLAARLAGQLPITINEKNELLAGDRAPVSLDGAGLCLVYYNPLAPARCIYLVATDMPVEDARKWLTSPQYRLLGSHGMERVDQADLAVLALDGAARRYMQFTDGWQWRHVDGAEVRLPEKMAFANAQTAAGLRVMQSAARADFVFDWADKSGVRCCDPQWFTRADMAIAAMPRELQVMAITGEELRILYDAVASGDALALPATLPASIEPQRMYRIAMPSWFSWMLAGKRLTLRETQALPDWPAEALWDEVFTE